MLTKGKQALVCNIAINAKMVRQTVTAETVCLEDDSACIFSAL